MIHAFSSALGLGSAATGCPCGRLGDVGRGDTLLRRGCGHGNVCIVIVIIRAVVGRHCSGRGEKKEDRRKEKKVKRRGKKAPPQPLKLNVEVWPVLTLEALVTLVQTQNSGCLRKGRKREGQGVFWPVKLNTSLPFLIGRFFSYTKRRLLCIYEAYSALCMYVCMLDVHAGERDYTDLKAT